MGGGGSSAPIINKGPSDAQNTYEKRASLSSNPVVGNLLSDYGQGKISLADALAKVKSGTADNAAARSAYQDSHVNQDRTDYASRQASNKAAGNEDPSDLFNEADEKDRYGKEYDAAHKNSLGDGDVNQFMSLIGTDPSSAQRYNQDQLQNDPLTKGLFGAGGLQDQSQANYKNAASELQGVNDAYKNPNTFALNQDDHTIYGQLSGNIARQFGSEEQGLAQSLADRGLGAAPNGVASQQFSGMYGNKMEQLAQTQRQVAQDRVNQTMSLLQQRQNLNQSMMDSSGQMAQGLGNMGQNAMSNMYNRNLAGRNANMGELASSAGQTLAQQQAQQNALNEQFSQQQATKGPGLGDILGSVAGIGVGAATGGLGSALGAGIGKSLAGGLMKATSDSSGSAKS